MQHALINAVRKPRRATVNFVTEGVTLVLLILIVATGLLMAYRIPAGRGLGHSVTLAGLTRHEWGTIHFYLALGFLALVVFHLAMHWRWIWSLARGQNPRASGWRGPAFILLTLALLSLIAAPWMMPLGTETGAGRRSSAAAAAYLAPETEGSARR